jgi:G:T-mismatch repair DNA endonuclease (very short patch repair protein)
MLKVCIKCKQEKETSEFNKNKYKKDGLSYQCKACTPSYYIKKGYIKKPYCMDESTKKWGLILTKKFLVQKYTNENISMLHIAKMVGCTDWMVKKYLRIHNIYIKSLSEIKKGRKKNWTKEEKEVRNLKISRKLMGRKSYHNSETGNKISKAKKGIIYSEERTKKILQKVCARPNKFEFKCLEYLNKLYPNKFKYTGDGSFIVNGHSVDAYSEELNTIVLFQGDYWHCNPEIYKADYYNKQFKKTAQEVWDRDVKIVEMIKKEGYKIIIIWEKETKNWQK